MKGFVMQYRSRYKGLVCPHCHQLIRIGQSFIGHTLYVAWTADATYVQSQSSHGPESMVRLAYHRQCLEDIVNRCPTTDSDVAMQFERYRAELHRQYEETDESLSS